MTEALQDAVYRIRHRVYCEDLGYEPLHADGRERDEYDAQSLHILIRNVRTGQFIGCTRIIRTQADAPERPLPFEIACAQTLDRSIVDPERLDRRTVAEVSRLAVIGEFRRRKGERRVALPLSADDFGTAEQPRFPYIPVGLYLATVELARLNGIETLFVLTERRLASHFAKLGVRIRTIGAPVEHRGTRIPSMLGTREVIAELKPLLRPLYERIAADLARGGADRNG
jgi:N-acyl amino acid synthase of PEP-CTERM/exosortase system